MLVRLSRTVARRANISTAKRHLEGAFRSSLRKYDRIKVNGLRVRLTENGHYAEAEVVSRRNETTTAEFFDDLKEALINRFDPPWLILGEGEGSPATASTARLLIAPSWRRFLGERSRR